MGGLGEVASCKVEVACCKVEVASCNDHPMPLALKLACSRCCKDSPLKTETLADLAVVTTQLL
jgi:hypothetical protein